MTHFEFNQDTFDRMEMLASNDSFDVLVDMELTFKDMNIFEIVNEMLKNKDPRALNLIYLTFCKAMTGWVEETYSEKELEKKEVGEHIFEIQMEVLRLITTFLNIDLKVFDDESFGLRYHKN